MKALVKLSSIFLLLVVLVSIRSTAFASEEVKMYTYADDGIVEGSKDFILEAVNGATYTIKLTFTGMKDTKTTVSFAYDLVTDDQMVANVQGGSDRSGLLNETCVSGKEEVRTFIVSALSDEIKITATGECKVVSIELKKQEEKVKGDKVTVYTIGDSLVQTYTDRYAPQTGWGQKLDIFFTKDVNFVNHAIGGRSSGNFIRQGRFNEVLSKLCPGDFVMIQFGHNDATVGNADRYVSIEDYKKNLINVYIKAIKDRGATPILVTLCNRNDYNAATGKFNVSFANYVEAMREVAAETGEILIDLNAYTVDKFTQINKELGIGATEALIFNHAIAGAYTGDYVGGVADNTHLQGYGATIVGEFLASELKRLELPGVSEFYKPIVVENVPSAPTNIQTKKYSGFISRIKWSAVKGADYYEVYVAKAKDGQATEDFKFAGYTTVCDFAYAKAALKNDYAYKIVAVNAAGKSPESEIYYFKAKETETKKKNDPNSDFVVVKDEGLPMGVIIGIVAAAVVVIVCVVAVLVKVKKGKK